MLRKGLDSDLALPNVHRTNDVRRGLENYSYATVLQVRYQNTYGLPMHCQPKLSRSFNTMVCTSVPSFQSPLQRGSLAAQMSGPE